MCIGPVGLALGNSTLMFSGARRDVAAEAGASASTWPSAREYQPSLRRRFRNPGPATSALDQRVAELVAQSFRDPVGDVARIVARDRRADHRGIGRKIAVRLAFRALERDARGRRSAPATSAAAAPTVSRSPASGSLREPFCEPADTNRRDTRPGAYYALTC